jgi:16S rRNA (cytosine967-C5)-methyltransferase
MKKNERLQALTILTAVLEENTPLSHLMPSAANLSPLSKELCFGVCRHYFRLAAIADKLLKKRPKALDVWASLLMGLYQLHYLRVPDYAVVKETVALLEQRRKSWAKGLINAILRTFCREQETLLPSLQNNPAFLYGHPTWFIKRLKKAWPDHWQSILQANDRHPPMSLRVNSKHTSVQIYLKRLQDVGIDAHPHEFSSQGMVLTVPCDVQTLPGFAAGDISVQDQAAQLAVSLLDLKPGLRLLDACAAPGGKTCHILETEPSLASCVALDIDNKRLARVDENLKRLNLQATLIKGDGARPETWWDGVLFDRILLDAPCSATGVIRRHPDIKLLRTEADITAVTQLQHDLLHALWPLLAPGGLMVYATCSVMPEENELQIRQFIANQANCQFVEPPSVAWGHATAHGWQILPGDSNMDGFFYSLLTKQRI